MLWVRSGEPFPWGAITALALAKMVITPILGVALTRLFARAGFVDQEDKVLQFVCIVFSCPPSATTQLRIPYANLLAYGVGGTSFGVFDPAICSY
ncbi:hypothetical protein BC827DRAFT_1266388 [Russula dissimulans]|nr:hypothetical protein BC827DRAFT_1266388 [Russula dissimulans]